MGCWRKKPEKEAVTIFLLRDEGFCDQEEVTEKDEVYHFLFLFENQLESC